MTMCSKENQSGRREAQEDLEVQEQAVRDVQVGHCGELGVVLVQVDHLCVVQMFFGGAEQLLERL